MNSITSFSHIDFRPSQGRNELFLRGRRRSSLASSLSSHDSGGSSGGGKLKIRTASWISCRSDPLRPGGRKPPGKKNHQAVLLLGRHVSLSVIRSKQARHPRSYVKGTTASSSNKNEEWDLSTTQTTARDLRRARIFSLHEPIRPPVQNDLLKPSRRVESSEPSQPKPRASDAIVQHKILRSCLKKDKQTCGKKEKVHRRVAFAAAHDKCIGNSHMDDGELWYKLADHDRFLLEATVRVGLTGRTMRYVAHTERTYNSSTGLVAPQVLHEYLSIPEEIIGLEHLLSAQKMARENLKSRHAKVLLREQDRQRQEGRCDAHSLAESVRSSSTISAHMAQERASFVSLV